MTEHGTGPLGEQSTNHARSVPEMIPRDQTGPTRIFLKLSNRLDERKFRKNDEFVENRLIHNK